MNGRLDGCRRVNSTSSIKLFRVGALSWRLPSLIKRNRAAVRRLPCLELLLHRNLVDWLAGSLARPLLLRIWAESELGLSEKSDQIMVQFIAVALLWHGCRLPATVCWSS